MTECITCGNEMRLDERQAAKLDCAGVHFLVSKEDDIGIPIRNRGLQTKTGVIMEKVEYGIFVEVGSYSDLYGCRIGNHTKIGSHVVIPEGTRIGNNVIVGDGVIFCNDRSPRSPTGSKWKLAPVTVESYVVIGPGAIILPGVKLEASREVMAGEVVRS